MSGHAKGPGCGGLTILDTSCPCLTCSIKITQVGISEVVYSQGYSMDQEVCPGASHFWFARTVLTSQTAAVFAEGGVRLRQFSPVSLHCLVNAGIDCTSSRDIQPRKGLVHLNHPAEAGEIGASEGLVTIASVRIREVGL